VPVEVDEMQAADVGVVTVKSKANCSTLERQKPGD
jgi:hypothetical protein